MHVSIFLTLRNNTFLQRTKFLSSFDKIVITASFFWALWDKIVTHPSSFLTLCEKLVNLATNISVLWDKIVLRLTDFLAICDKFVIIVTKNWHYETDMWFLPQNCGSRHSYFDTVRQNVILATNCSELWDKKITSHFLRHCDAKLSFTCQSFRHCQTKYQSKSQNGCRFQAIMSLPTENFLQLWQYCAAHQSFLTPLDKKMTLGSKFLALWDKILIQLTKFPSLRNKFAILAIKISALWEKNMNQLTKVLTE